MRLIGLICLTLVLVAGSADAFGRRGRRHTSNACVAAVSSCAGAVALAPVVEVVPAPKTAVAVPVAAPVACVAVQATGCVGAQSFTTQRRGLFKRRAGCGG